MDQNTGNTPKNTEKNAIYHWSYAEQVTLDEQKRHRARRHGAAVYALIMAAAFAVTLLLLCGVLMLTDTDAPTQAPETTPGGVAFERTVPATVLVYAIRGNEYSYGTGFFVDPNGYIVTNYHVIRGGSSLQVTLATGEELDAELVGYSVNTDLAVLKVEGFDYPCVTFGDSADLQVGDTVVAVGNPGGADVPWTTTEGIISYPLRQVEYTTQNAALQASMIQFDAAVNSGNSGGPLCNADGEVIGIVSRKLSEHEGIGFAIPINEARAVIGALINGTDPTEAEGLLVKARYTIGIRARTIRAEENYISASGTTKKAGRDGVYVSTVDETGAAKGLLKPDDIITALDGNEVRDVEALQQMLTEYQRGDTLHFTVYRDGAEVTVQVTLK